MTELLKKLPLEFEPKKINRFVVRFENSTIEEWVVHKVSKPIYNFEDGWKDIVVELRDPIGPSTSLKLFREIIEPAIQEKNESQHIFIEMLDPTSEVVERWKITGHYEEIDFGVGDYSKDDLVTIKITFKPTMCELEF
jgi:hypothetical protein